VGGWVGGGGGTCGIRADGLAVVSLHGGGSMAVAHHAAVAQGVRGSIHGGLLGLADRVQAAAAVLTCGDPTQVSVARYIRFCENTPWFVEPCKLPLVR